MITSISRIFDHVDDSSFPLRLQPELDRAANGLKMRGQLRLLALPFGFSVPQFAGSDEERQIHSLRQVARLFRTRPGHFPFAFSPASRASLSAFRRSRFS